MKLKIEGEVVEVKKVFTGGYLPLLDCDNGCEYYVASDSESAGDAARKYWEDMARSDPKEFVCIIGESRLVNWAIGQSDEYGFDCMLDFLDAVAKVPEEQWAGYDGNELEVEEIQIPDDPESIPPDEEEDKQYEEAMAEHDEWQELIEELGFRPTVAYRHN